MKGFSKQEWKVYCYIRDHAGCTTHDITRDTFIQKPCARIVGLKNKGVEIEIVGEVKYEGTHAFKKYAIGTPLKKKVYEYSFNPYTQKMEERQVEVSL